MAALKSPFSGENMNLQILIEKIEKCDYQDLPDNLYSFEVIIFYMTLYTYNSGRQKPSLEPKGSRMTIDALFLLILALDGPYMFAYNFEPKEYYSK